MSSSILESTPERNVPCPCYISEPGNITNALLSMEGQKALRFHQKYLNLCSEDEQRSSGFGTT